MTSPHDVNTPLHSWELVDVLLDGRDVLHADSLAIGKWADKPRLASRWDRSETSEKGNPVSRGYPTWFVLPEWMEIPLIGAANIPEEKKWIALKFLGRRNENV